MVAPTTAIPFSMAVARQNNWRTRTIAFVLMLAIGAIFWVDSRYPSLLKKYNAGTHVKVVGAISFDTVYSVDRSMPLAKRVWKTSVNWLHANEIGMTFGFFFGAAALAFLATLPRRRTRFRFVNALMGAVMGMPLGVCANCVAPIGRGLYASGMSAESVLAAMFSSPALNVIVLAMTFTLFPLPMALLKVVSVLLLIFVVAPLVGAMQREKTEEVACPIKVLAAETWGRAVFSAGQTYARSFWYVFRVGAPLMILAAVLGALAIELVPQNALTAQVTLGGIVLVALIGAFLPVPMAFDVVIAYIAMTRGVPLPYVATILCTLGIYSVYSYSVVGKTISWKAASAVYGAVVGLGVVAGIAAMGLR
jgi:uncharacterized membrane protein YraQ (UPF0718 family)